MCPGGADIAFNEVTAGGFDIHVMTADGRARTPVVQGGGSQERPSWSPDGRRLVFYADDDGDWDVYTVGRDGTGRRQLTREPGYDGQPAWQPTA